MTNAVRAGMAVASVACLLLGGCAGGSGSGNAVAVRDAAAPVSARDVFRSLNLEQDLIPRGHAGRWKIRPMTPVCITIHSTQNYDAEADARRHAEALKRGALRAWNNLGYLTWHFSVDDRRTVQHLPTSERGEHSDFEGPGNRTSIGIEMCENAGGRRDLTVDRAARLAASLAEVYQIPTRRIVPHYHWARWRGRDAHKNCPHFLLENGRPATAWRGFLRLVDSYRRTIVQDLSRAPDVAPRLALRRFCEGENGALFQPESYRYGVGIAGTRVYGWGSDWGAPDPRM